MSFLDTFFSNDGFMPLGFCLSWRPDVLWAEVIGNAIIALSYVSIPLAILYYEARRRELEYRWVLILLSLFVTASGTTYAFDIWTLWFPDYGVDALLKILTALVSAITAVVLWWLMPQALSYPSRQKLERKNAELHDLTGRLAFTVLEQAETAEALRRTEDRYRALVETQIEMVLWLGRDGCLSFANETTCRVLGLGRGDLIGRSWQDFVNPADHPETAARIAVSLSPPYPRVRVDNRILTQDGERWYAWEAAAVVDSDKVTMLQAVGRDITGQRRLEADLRQAKENAEADNFAKSRFLATMSHELRTPLNTILGFSEMMLDPKYGTIKDDRYLEYLGYIHESGTHLVDVITDVLDISKIEAGVMGIEPIPIPVGSALLGVSRLLNERVQRKGLTLDVKVPTDIPPLWADERALKQMLFNLISNAIKFTPKGGKITLSAAVAADGIDIMVADTGIGIPADQIERVLKPFEQFDNRYSRSAEGTGLGLALVHGLAKLHGGGVSVRSAPGEGSTFTVRLPAATTATTATTAS